jgi:regulatory protein
VALVSTLKATRSGRIAVHLDGEYACTVGAALLVRLGLFVGLDLTEDQVDQLRTEASAERALADAHRLLGHRARAQAELGARLTAKGHPEQVVQRVLEHLQESGLLDDQAFARAYVADARRLYGWGSERITRELARLGADPAAVQAALSDTGAGDAQADELQRALQVLSKQRPGAPAEAARRRAYQLLLRRGFSATVAYDAVRQWSADMPADEEEST